MKHYLLFILGLMSINLSAQITIDADIYPQIGDTLRIMNAVLSSQEDTVSSSGPDQTWDYRNLQDGIVVETNYISVEDTELEVMGAVSATALPTGGFIYNGETTDHFGVLALNQEVALPGLELVFASYDEPLADYHASLMYEDDFNNMASLVSSSIPGDLIPDELFDSLGIPVSPDSIRLEQAYTRISRADAWGVLTTPTGTYEVLRERRENRVSNSVGLFSEFLGWITIPLGEPDVTVQYIYWSNVQSEPIMLQNIDDNGLVTAIQYYTEQRLVANDELIDRSSDSRVFPNPSTSQSVQLDIPQDAEGFYQLNWYDFHGRLVQMTEQELLAGGQNISLPETKRNVLYLYARSEQQDIMIRHRIMIGR